MPRLTVTTPSRLHFGLLAVGPDAPRRFGGVGLMVEAPGLEVAIEPAAGWSAAGPLADRALAVAGRVAERLAIEGVAVHPGRLTIRRAPPEHVGFGVGTQLGLAVARLVAEASGIADPAIDRLADWSGRGLRSGIGLHGFAGGGLIVDGGRASSGGIPPLLTRLAFPADWSVLVAIPATGPGLHGSAEVRALADLPPFADARVDRLCRLVLLGLLPNVVERDLPAFGAALGELQREVGRGFASAQGGTFAGPESAALVAHLESIGLHGVGQSSWGPTIYGFADQPEPTRRALLDGLRTRFGLGPDRLFWTSASRSGATLIAG